MSNMEFIIALIGFILIIISFLLVKFCDDNLADKHFKRKLTIAIISAILGIILMVTGFTLCNIATTEKETTTISVVVTDKDTTYHHVRYAGYRCYYLCSNDIKVQVDYDEYCKYEIGDNMTIYKKTEYQINRETKEREQVLDVYYLYKGNNS